MFGLGKQATNHETQLAKRKVRSAYLQQCTQIKSKRYEENKDLGNGHCSL